MYEEGNDRWNSAKEFFSDLFENRLEEVLGIYLISPEETKAVMDTTTGGKTFGGCGDEGFTLLQSKWDEFDEEELVKAKDILMPILTKPMPYFDNCCISHSQQTFINLVAPHMNLTEALSTLIGANDNLTSDVKLDAAISTHFRTHFEKQI